MPYYKLVNPANTFYDSISGIYLKGLYPAYVASSRVSEKIRIALESGLLVAILEAEYNSLTDSLHDAVNQSNVSLGVMPPNQFYSAESQVTNFPSNAQSGSAYLVSGTPDSELEGVENYLLLYNNSRAQFLLPSSGSAIWLKSTGVIMTYNGSTWEAVTGTEASPDTILSGTGYRYVYKPGNTTKDEEGNLRFSWGEDAEVVEKYITGAWVALNEPI
jgi:hypothetical protein